VVVVYLLVLGGGLLLELLTDTFSSCIRHVYWLLIWFGLVCVKDSFGLWMRGREAVELRSYIRICWKGSFVRM
jgi:hypothetical protein